MEYIKVRPDGWGFEEADSAKLMIPVGCNYFDPTVGWPPKIWSQYNRERVQRHFDQMQALGVNTVRIVISAGYFMPQLGEWNAENLKKLDDMVAIGRAHGIRFILSSLDWWDGWPKWIQGDVYVNPEALARQAIWFEKLYEHFRGDGTIFAADIRNEPQIHWDNEDMRRAWAAWLSAPQGQALGQRLAGAGHPLTIPENKPAPFNEHLYGYQRFRESVAEAWVKNCAGAIRRGDPRRLVSVGLVQWSFPLANSPGGYGAFNPKDLAPHLDYISAHFYPILAYGKPLGEQWDLMQRYGEAWLRYAADANKPLVVEEFGWYGGGTMNGIYCSQEDLANWNKGVIEFSRASACGWLSWAYGDCPSASDCSCYGGLVSVDGKKKLWGETFQQMAPDLKQNLRPRQPARSTVQLNLREWLTSLGETATMYETACAARLLEELARLEKPWDFTLER